MKAVWKYPLAVTDEQTIEVPLGYDVLAVQFQNGQLCLWALVDPAQATRKRRIRIVGTGQPFDARRHVYLGTAQQGPLVWHIFEVV